MVHVNGHDATSIRFLCSHSQLKYRCRLASQAQGKENETTKLSPSVKAEGFSSESKTSSAGESSEANLSPSEQILLLQQQLAEQKHRLQQQQKQHEQLQQQQLYNSQMFHQRGNPMVLHQQNMPQRLEGQHLSSNMHPNPGHPSNPFSQQIPPGHHHQPRDLQGHPPDFHRNIMGNFAQMQQSEPIFNSGRPAGMAHQNHQNYLGGSAGYLDNSMQARVCVQPQPIQPVFISVDHSASVYF